MTLRATGQVETQLQSAEFARWRRELRSRGVELTVRFPPSEEAFTKFLDDRQVVNDEDEENVDQESEEDEPFGLVVNFAN